MNKISYEYMDSNGKKVKHNFLGNIDEFNSFIEKENIIITKLKSKKYSKKNLSLKQWKNLFFMLSLYFKSSDNIYKAISTCTNVCSDKKILDFLNRVRDGVSHGYNLYDSFMESGYEIPWKVSTSIKLTIEKNNLKESIKNLYDYYDFNYNLRKGILGACIYPLIVVALIFISIISMLYFFIPFIFESLGEIQGDIIEDFFRKRKIITIGCSFCNIFIIAIILTMKKNDKFKSIFMLHIPVLKNVYKKYFNLLICNNIYMCNKEGILINDSINMISDEIKCPFFKSELQELSYNIQLGMNLNEAISKNKCFIKEIKDFISMGYESENLESALEHCVTYLKVNMKTTIDTYIKLLQPVILIICSIFIMTVLWKVMKPLIYLGDNIFLIEN